MALRTLSVLICVIVLALLPAFAAPTVTVAQLEQFLTSSRAARLSDTEIAERLNKVDLSEQLTSASLARILAESSLGPNTEEQLELLAVASVIQPPPAVELSQDPAPDQPTQGEMISLARGYAGNALHRVPNFLAVRDTLAFNNVPGNTSGKRRKPRSE